ncbi:unnamed protein product [Vitrella brassicaformis CCMP3155]|uniref:Uncharacterized protein n=1 Tax=Vitrella brassicaformis (strain CCMP3155) TaxID=1169540 RepID=A0A0G4EAH4_VITBC|nr:unnamed protein product [Vitrella brassicaformis CCMP3155]|eukprot:CEL92244.1 unnamed protein product [Vitrella brassicaformis CCMP3155]
MATTLKKRPKSGRPTAPSLHVARIYEGGIVIMLAFAAALVLSAALSGAAGECIRDAGMGACCNTPSEIDSNGACSTSFVEDKATKAHNTNLEGPFMGGYLCYLKAGDEVFPQPYSPSEYPEIGQHTMASSIDSGPIKATCNCPLDNCCCLFPAMSTSTGSYAAGYEYFPGTMQKGKVWGDYCGAEWADMQRGWSRTKCEVPLLGVSVS